MKTMRSGVALLALAGAIGLGPAAADVGRGLHDRVLTNPTAYIPAQCYTVTQDAPDGRVYNPCQTCHVRPRAPNFVNDVDLQQEYAFPETARENRWTNLFKDRRAAIAAVPDAEILAYARQGNYFDATGAIALAERLKTPPAAWDADGDGVWSGYTPDCRYDFDAEGFDRRPDGGLSGWRALAYAPLPGGFWPTNGSMDDVLIRLPALYRQNAAGEEDVAIYKINLAVVEALIQRRDVAIDPVEEGPLGVDLDKDGALGVAEKIAYDWAPLEGREMSYVGAAKAAQARGEAKLAAGLFPLGTEFLHSLYYLDLDENGAIAMAPRMKELRYSVKTRWQTYADLEEGALAEAKETEDFPDRFALFDGDAETGIGNGWGWRLQGFIEDETGALRPQSFEETVFCIGCHGGVGANDDSSLAFARKFPAESAPARGWYHWRQKSLRGAPEPIRADGRREMLRYLETAGAGDEYRANDEILSRFFDAEGRLDPARAAAFEHDLSELLFPSPERALALNKAYREIVREQSFILGRDAVVAPAQNVHRRLEAERPTGVETPERAARW